MSVSIAVTSVVSSGQSAHIARTLPRLSATFRHGLARGAPCLGVDVLAQRPRISSGLMNRHSIRHAACSLVTMGFERKRRRTRSHSRSYAAFCRRMTAASAATAAPIRARSPGPRPRRARVAFSRRARERCGERRRERAFDFREPRGGRTPRRAPGMLAGMATCDANVAVEPNSYCEKRKQNVYYSISRPAAAMASAPRTCRYLR